MCLHRWRVSNAPGVATAIHFFSTQSGASILTLIKSAACRHFCASPANEMEICISHAFTIYYCFTLQSSIFTLIARACRKNKRYVQNHVLKSFPRTAKVNVGYMRRVLSCGHDSCALKCSILISILLITSSLSYLLILLYSEFFVFLIIERCKRICRILQAILRSNYFFDAHTH